MQTWVYAIPCIPDLTHHRYRALYPGDLRGHLFERAAQWLRTISRLPAEDVTVLLRGDFDPRAEKVQDRLRWSMCISTNDGLSAATVRTLTASGPMGPFYDFKEQDADSHWGLPRFDVGAVCEIVRREEAYRPLVTEAQNRFVPEVYYVVQPFEANEGNDWLLLDRVLSETEEPVRLELRVTPADARELRWRQLEWISNLLAVNAHDDSSLLPGDDGLPSGDIFGSESGLVTAPASSERRTRDPLADEFLRENQQLFQSLRKPQFRFALRVLALTREVATSVGTAVAESCFREGRYHLIGLDERDAAFAAARTDALSIGSCQGGLAPDVLPPGGLARTLIVEDLRALSRMATAEELGGAFRLPAVAGAAARTMRSSTDPRPQREGTKAVVIGHDMETGVRPENEQLGKLNELFTGANARVPQLTLSHDLFKKHLFIAGVPGSGKTTAVFNLLVQLHRNGIPFLVIEPAKTEYRALKALREHPDPAVMDLARELRVFTAGNESLSPLRFNPFEFPQDAGIDRDEHLALVMSSFKAGIPMWGPLEAIIADAIEAAYERLPEERSFPTMADVVAVAREIATGKGYEGEVRSNIEAAIGVRLETLTKRSVGHIFSDEFSLPTMSDLLSQPTVIELEHLPGEAACLLTLFILSGLREQMRVSRFSGQELQHVIVVEEAHNIVGRTGEAKAGEDSADPRAFAAQYVARMLAELRALGEGIIIADQLPSTVAPEVVKNTGTKLAGRLVSADDREELGAAMLLDPMQIEEIARLGPGEAYLYHEGLHRPRRVRALNAAAYLGLEKFEHAVAGSGLLDMVGADAWFQEVLEMQMRQVLAQLAEFSALGAGLQARVSAARGWIEEERKRAGSVNLHDAHEILKESYDSLKCVGRLQATVLALASKLTRLDRSAEAVLNRWLELAECLNEVTPEAEKLLDVLEDGANGQRSLDSSA